MNRRPPKIPLQFFRRFCDPEVVEDIEGDLLERFNKRPSRWLFAVEVLKLFRPGIIKRAGSGQKLNYSDMIKNDLKIAWRSMMKQKMYAAIKIGGFAIGIAACILISLFIVNEKKYDTHYKDGDRVFRIANQDRTAGTSRWTLLGAPVRNILYDHFAEIEQVARVILWDMRHAGNNQFRRAENKQNFYEEGFIYADTELFDILEIPMIYGEATHALQEPNTIVLSKSKADKHFPNENPVGKQVVLNDGKQLTVGGVMGNLPHNSHLQFEFAISLSGIEFWRGEQTDWCCKNYEYYVKLQPETDKVALENKLLYIRDQHIVPYLEATGSVDAQNFKSNRTYYLQPVQNIYMSPDEVGDMISIHGNEDVVWILGIIAVFILILASINFINLSTAKSARRSKEVGLRKVIGSHRVHLVVQHLLESVLYSFFAVLLGVSIAWLFLPYFNLIAEKSLVFPWNQLYFAPMMMGMVLLIGLVAGIYPALYLTAFKPIEALQGKIRQGAKNSKFQGVLVVFQFTVSLILIISALVVGQQMHYLLNKELGYDSQQVITIEATRTMGSDQQVFKEELLKMPEIKSATISSYIPIAGTAMDNQDFWKEGKRKIDQGIESRIWRTDDDYVETLNMKLAQGRKLDEKIASDTAGIIINETMANLLQLKEPVNSKIEGAGKIWNVVGVVEDFHFESIAEPIGPLGMVLGSSGSIILARISSDDMLETLTKVSGLWDSFMPHQAIRYSFLDERFQRSWTHKTLERAQLIFTAFAALALTIACLGLFALSAFTMEQRYKEISIRKVLGASFSSLFKIITVDYLKLVVIALIIAIPLGWFLMETFLADFPYRVEMQWTVFLVTGLGALIVVMTTVSKHAIELASKNPSEILKDE